MQLSDWDSFVNFLNSPTEVAYNEKAKTEFKTLCREALTVLAEELELKQYDVRFNAGGIAVSGDATLHGMWEDGKGIYVTVNKDGMSPGLMYRTVKSMTDYTGGQNNWIRFNDLRDFSQVVQQIFRLR